MIIMGGDRHQNIAIVCEFIGANIRLIAELTIGKCNDLSGQDKSVSHRYGHRITYNRIGNDMSGYGDKVRPAARKQVIRNRVTWWSTTGGGINSYPGISNGINLHRPIIMPVRNVASRILCRYLGMNIRVHQQIER